MSLIRIKPEFKIRIKNKSLKVKDVRYFSATGGFVINNTFVPKRKILIDDPEVLFIISIAELTRKINVCSLPLE